MANTELETKQSIQAILAGLSPEERELTLKALQEVAANGTSETLESLKYADFDEIPVDIHTFMHDPMYLGRGLYDNEGRFTVFPYWEKKLEEIFPDNVTTAYNTLVFTGAIGLGKSFVAVLCLLYMLYRLLCLKDPYSYYGMQPIDKLTISLMNITLENAKGVALDKMNQLILASDWFMAHGEMAGTTNLIYRPEKHIEVITASSNNQVIGRALFANFTDEVNFGLTNNVEKMKKKQLKLITQIDARMKSRFMRGTYLPTLNIIASSKDSEQSFLEEFINTKRETESKNTLIVDEPQWVVDSRKDSPIKFYVAIGDKLKANELLPLDITENELSVYRESGYQLVKVPIGYLDTFQQNLDEAICSIIGIATAASLKFMSGKRLVEAKDETYLNPFMKDVIEVGNDPEDFYQYANFFDLGRVNPNDKAKPLFIHLDMSVSGDKTGIAGVWITGKRQSIPGQDSSRELEFKLAFSVSVKAPRGAQVSFEKTRNFVRWLRDSGFAIKGISMDTFQSYSTQQSLKADGFNVKVLSVDRLDSEKQCKPYAFLKTAIYERHLKLYSKCDLLTEELLNLERKSDGHIDHPQSGSKDQADAVCGATYNASEFAEEYSYDYGDNLLASLAANDVGTDDPEARKRQFITDFQEELTKIHMDAIRADEETTKEQQKEYQWYQDIADGIIVI